MGFGDELFSRLSEARGPLASATQRLVEHPLFPLGTPEWMMNQYHVIRGTVPTLHFMLDECDQRLSDPFANTLEDYFNAKLFDEKGHDVLLLQDLERIGKTRDEIWRAPTDPHVSALVGSQFYLARHEHPGVYLGFIAVLEAFPPSAAEVEVWRQAAALPDDAVSCAKLHAQADIGHREDLRAILGEVPQGLHEAVERNALQCLELHRQAIMTLCRKLDSLHERAIPTKEAA